MITSEEAQWLFRCLLGREIPDPQTEDWLRSSFPDFATARSRLLLSKEFVLKFEKITESQRKRATASIDQVVLEGLAGGCPPTPEPRLHADIPSLPASFSVKLGELLPLRLIVSIGSEDEERLACEMLHCSRGGIHTVIQLTRESAVSGRINCISREVGSAAGQAIIIRQTLSLGALLAWLKTSGLSPDAAVVSPSYPADALADIYDALQPDGVLIFRSERNDSLKGQLDNFAKSRFRDAVHFGPITILHKRSWYLPLPQAHASAEPRIPPGGEIALACIVKNEAGSISTMLRSAMRLCSYAVIVDTGSIDDTIEVASDALSSMGKPFRTLSVPFTTFSAARNAAIAAVPDDIPWILMLDADEFLVAEDLHKFEKLLASEHDAWMLPRYNFTEASHQAHPGLYPDRQRRLFRHNSIIKFIGAVHESLTGVVNLGLAPADLSAVGGCRGGPHIHHTGLYRGGEQGRAAKTAFYKKLSGSI
jgi:hypothetical protein